MESLDSNVLLVVELMVKELSQYDREVFCILNMKNNGQVINMNLVSVGMINESLVISREVFKRSILEKSGNLRYKDSLSQQK